MVWDHKPAGRIAVTPATFTAKGAVHAYRTIGRPAGEGVPHIVWAHGWGQDHAAFLPLARSLERSARHTLIDFPGFGRSPQPPADWDTADYADAIAEWLASEPPGRRVWVGHSFGGRVGLRLAARHPGAVDAMVLVAAAGLKRHRSLPERLRIALRVRAYKALKLAERLGVDVSARKARYGSADYRNAGAMRSIFVKVIAEDQAQGARAIRCPVALLYGERDTETPPEIGERLSRLIPGATLKVIAGLDHHTILTDGAPQVVHQVSQMLER
jgi:pimeloyl-ACP methyl ester carboxylesterase